MKTLYHILLLSVFFQTSNAQEPVLKIGLVADPQYADKPTEGLRHYRESLWKLKNAIDTFNYKKVDFVQSLGDIIDEKWSSFDSIMPIYKKLNVGIQSYQLLGNHDFSIDSIYKGALLEKLSMPDYYYSYSKNGWKFIVLDATDYSYFANQLHNHNIKKVDSYYQNTSDLSNRHRWNSAIGKKQQKWLKRELADATSSNQKVILFSHLPIIPKGNIHNLWNDYEIVALIEKNKNVVAFINGHDHAGGYTFRNGVHYITLFAMVDTLANSYSILEINNDNLVLKGYGNQKTLHLKYK